MYESETGLMWMQGADPIYPPTYHSPTGEGFHPVDGDGLVSALRIHGGHADFKQRFVETERLKLERKAGRAMFGTFRNPFTHHPCVRQAIDATANTHILIHAGKMLALSERGAPYEVDPNTLDTLGYNPFGNLCKSKTFSAHCKADPATGELVTWFVFSFLEDAEISLIVTLGVTRRKVSPLETSVRGRSPPTARWPTRSGACSSSLRTM